MKKYGDDADSFRDQGTRVEESKKWHEANQLKHNYSYRSSSKPKSSYKPDYSKTYYKPKSKSKYVHSIGQTSYNPIVRCPKCGKLYSKNTKGCPNCHISEPSKIKQNNSKIVICPKCGNQYHIRDNGELVNSCPHCGTSNIIKCRKCGKEYNKIHYILCPYCKYSPSNDKSILALCFVLILIFAIIMSFLL